MNRTDRLLAVLLEIQARGQLRAEDLAARFEVSVRTIYRDLDALSESGVPLVALPGTGYRLMDGYFLPPLTFSATEAGLLTLGGEYIRDRVDVELRTAADEALQKLTGVLPSEQRDAVARWRRSMLFPRVASADAPLLRAVRSAIQERRVLQLRYHAFRRAEPEPRDVEPFSLVYMSERWQVAAYCRLRQGPRMFRLDRIEQLDVLGEQFTLGERHAPPKRTGDWKDRAPEAHIRFDASIVRWVRERQPFTFLREELDSTGPLFVYAIRNERDLLAWLLGWGAAMQVVHPLTLRRLVAEESRAIFARHTSAPDTLLSTGQVQTELAV